MCNLRLVDRNNHNQKANPKTCKPAASPKILQILSSSLKRSTEEVNYAANNDGPSSAEFVGKWTCEASTTECSASEEADYDTSGDPLVLF